MEKNYLAKQYALISLNGEEASNKTVVGKMKNRVITAAVFLEDILEEKMALGEWIKKIQKLPQKKCNQIADSIKVEMKAEDILEEIPSLLECDVNYETLEIRINQYRADYDTYTRTAEYIKAEMLDGGEISDEVLCLVWLLKQSGDLGSVFSTEEMHVIKEKYIQLYRENELANNLFETDLKVGGSVWWKNFLAAKKKWARTPMGAGIVSRFPVLERSESVFIATEKWFPNSEERIDDVRKLLTDRGHICELKHEGPVALMEIDHVLYELVPDGMPMKTITIHGVRLRRYLI